MNAQNSGRSIDDQRLEHELEAALDVAPSGDFVARIRNRVAAEPASHAWRTGWRTVAAGGVMVSLMAAAWLLVPAEPGRTVEFTRLVSRQVTPEIVGSGPDVRSQRVSAMSGSTGVLATDGRALVVPLGTPIDVQVPVREVVSLRLFVAAVREGRVDADLLATVSDEPEAKVQSPEEIEIQPIAIASLAPVTLLEGDVQ